MLTDFTETDGFTFSTLQASNSGSVNDWQPGQLGHRGSDLAGSAENLTLGGL